MRPIIDALSLILLIIVIAIGWKLRSVLGTRNDDERPGARADAYRLNRDAFENRPDGAPDPTSPPDAASPPDAPEAPDASDAHDAPDAPPAPKPAQGLAEPGAPAPTPTPTPTPTPAPGRGLAYLREIEPEFDETGFLDGAKRAYEMILAAFADGDLTPVRGFLGEAVAAGFDAAIATRHENNRQLVTRILRLDRPALDDARVEGGLVELDVRFRAEIISFSGPREAAIDEDKLPPPAMIQDIWTFARRQAAQDSNWSLVATHSA